MGLPKSFFESSEVSNDPNVNIIDFHNHRNVIWRKIVDDFYKSNNALVVISGTVVKLGKPYNNSIILTIENTENKTLSIYIKNRNIIIGEALKGSSVTIKGYFNVYKNPKLDNGVVQMNAVEVKVSNNSKKDIKEFIDYVNKKKKKRKINISKNKKYKIALLTSKGSEAREDIKNVLDSRFTVVEYFTNLFDKSDIANQLKKLNQSDFDIIIISRCGIDMINVFDDQEVVNEIFNSISKSNRQCCIGKSLG